MRVERVRRFIRRPYVRGRTGAASTLIFASRDDVLPDYRIRFTLNRTSYLRTSSVSVSLTSS